MAEDPITDLLLGAAGVVLLNDQRKRRREKRRWWVRPINQRRNSQGAYNILLNEMRLRDTDMFLSYTRMTVDLFDELLARVGPSLKKTSLRPSIPEGCRLAITLRYLATGESLSSIALAFRCGVATVCQIYRETTKVIWDVLNEEVMPAPTTEKWKEIACGFEKAWQLPNCVGAIDGKHIAIKCPPHSGSLYFNYKKFYSVVLLAVCDADYKFVYINSGALGSESDGGIFQKSSLGRAIWSGSLNLPKNAPLPGTNIEFPYYFVGDEAFPLHNNILRPYGGTFLPEEKLIYNYRLSRGRRCIENAFGILASRWRILHTTIEAHPDSVDDIIKATVCLHNYIKTNNADIYCPPNLHNPQQSLDNGPEEDNISVPASASAAREGIKDYFNNTGAVQWQYGR